MLDNNSAVSQAIANGTATSAGALTGTEVVPVSRGGLFSTTLSTIANFIATTYTTIWYSGIANTARTTVAKIGDFPITQKDFGAKVDGKRITDGAITAAQNAFTSASANFKLTDVGKLIAIAGAGANGTTLTTTIATYVSTSSVTLSAAASNTVSGATTWYGTDDTAAIQAALNAALVNSLNFHFAPGTSCTNGSITYTATGNETIKVGGAGKGVSRIINFAFTQTLSFVGNVSAINGGTRGTYRDFTVGRPNYDAFTGTIGPKSLYVSYAYDSLMEGIEEYGAIGYGLQFDLSTDVVMRKNYVHNHFGGSSGPVGTDGIHAYRCTNPIIEDNIIHDVGDDATSSGSYANTNPAIGVIMRNNRAYSCGGAANKLYGLVQRAHVHSNYGQNTASGGTQLSDDFFNFSSAYGPSISDVLIENNQYVDITGGSYNIGGIYLNNWAPASGSTSTSMFTNIVAKGNNILNCNCGIGQRAAGPTQMTASGLELSNNTVNGTTGGDGITLYQWGGTIAITNNKIRNIYGLGIHLDVSTGTPYANSTIVIEGNKVDGYGQSGVASCYGLWLRPNDQTMKVFIRNNDIINQAQPTAGTGYASAIIINTVHPASVIEKNYTDGPGINLTNALSGGYQGEPTDTTTPSAGTWYVGQKVWNTSVSSTAGPFQVCNVPGTFGTLTGITGTIAAGSNVLQLNSTTGLFNGCVITISGVFGPGPNGQFTVVKISGTSAYLNGTANVAATSAAVAFSTPTFVSAASAGGIYAGNLGTNVIINFTNMGGGIANFTPGSGITASLGTSTYPWSTQYRKGPIVESGEQLISSPTSGTVETISQTTPCVLVSLAATLAALTFDLPTPLGDGHKISFILTQGITAITWTPTSGITVNGSIPTSTSSYATFSLKYISTLSEWLLSA
jgi:hypothetical protein